MRGGRAFSMPDRRDTARGRAALTTPPMRPLRLPPKDNAVPANFGNAPAVQGRHSSRAQRMQPPTVTRGQRRSCALRQFDVGGGRLRRRFCVPSGNAPAAQGRHSSRAQTMQPQTVAQGQRRSRQLRQCVRCACRPRTTPFPPTLLMRPLRRRSCASRQCACRTRTTQLPRPKNAAADSHARTTPFPPTPTMRPPRKDDTAPAPRECSRRPSPKDNAIPARCSIMRRLRSHSRTTPFLCPPSIRRGGRLCL